jgi:hypothetical protein
MSEHLVSLRASLLVRFSSHSIFWPTEHTEYTEENSGSVYSVCSVGNPLRSFGCGHAAPARIFHGDAAPSYSVFERLIVTVLISIRIVPFRDDSSCGVGPHLGARRKSKRPSVRGTDQGPALHLTCWEADQLDRLRLPRWEISALGRPWLV